MAWLQTKAPKQPEIRGKMSASKYPPLGPEEYLVNMAGEVGIYEATWQDIAGWSQATGTPLTAFEAGAIRRISNAYTAAVREYAGKSVPPPWHDGVIDTQAVAEQARSAFRSRNRGNRKSSNQG